MKDTIAAPDADQAEGPSLADVDELCAEFSFHYEDGDSLEILQEMITAAITRWRAPVAQPTATPALLQQQPTTPPALPSDCIDPEHQGEEWQLLEAFQRAWWAEGGSPDKSHMAGIRAVLALRPSVAAVRAADAAISGEAIGPEYQGEDRKLLEAFRRAWWADGGKCDDRDMRGIRAVLALRPSVAAVRAADAAIADEAIEAEFRAWWRAKVHPLTAPAYHTTTTHIAWGRHLLSRGKL